MKRVNPRVILVICVVFLISCRSSVIGDGNHARLNADQVAKINARYYALAGQGYSEVTFQCESQFFKTMVDRIKDPILKGQLENTVFTVKWAKPASFLARVDNIPELPKKEDDEILVKAIVHAKDRIRGAFQMSSIFFDGVISGSNSYVIQENLTRDGLNVFSVKSPQKDTVLKLYFKENFLLDKAELVNGSKVKAEIQYEFEELRDGKYLLKNASASYPGLSIGSSIDIRYGGKGGAIVIEQVKVRSTMEDESIDDLIEVTWAS